MTLSLKPLAQQRIVITGASSGIGLAIAEEASAAGASVMLAARNEDALSRIQQRLDDSGAKVAIFVADVADRDYAERLAEATIEKFGGFDTWVNDAAAATYGTLARTPVADQRRVFDVGYWGTVNGALAALAHLRTGGGAIINIGSVLSDRAMIQQGPYSAMKHAVKGFTEALRTEVLEDGLPVSVTLIKPSAMHTPYPEHARNRMDSDARLPPIVYDPRLVARAVLFAAQTPRRELTVGGFGAATALANAIAPGLVDRAMAAFGSQAQHSDQAPPPGTADNLYEPRADGAVEGQEEQYVRRRSLWLDMQMQSPATLLIGATALGMAAAGIVRLGRGRAALLR